MYSYALTRAESVDCVKGTGILCMLNGKLWISTVCITWIYCDYILMGPEGCGFNPCHNTCFHSFPTPLKSLILITVCYVCIISFVPWSFIHFAIKTSLYHNRYSNDWAFSLFIADDHFDSPGCNTIAPVQMQEPSMQHKDILQVITSTAWVHVILLVYCTPLLHTSHALGLTPGGLHTRLFIFSFSFFAQLAWGRKMWQTLRITKNFPSVWWVCRLAADFISFNAWVNFILLVYCTPFLHTSQPRYTHSCFFLAKPQL